MNRRELDPSSSPSAALGVQLRRSREGRSLTQAQLGETISFSASYISRIERGVEPPSRRLAQEVDRALETGGTIELMLDQLEHSVLIEGFPEFAEHESRATAIRLFEIGVVPGLLQVQSYAEAYEMAAVRQGNSTQAQAAERLAFLRARQARLSEARPPTVQAVLDATCLLRPIGGAGVMVEQLRHLEALADCPMNVLQVAPLELGEDRPLNHPLVLLSLPDRRVMGYTETLQRGYLERDAETVAGWVSSYDRLQVEALSRAASVAYIRKVRKDFEDHAR
ncbi:Scr1 family TA system antitoxin-like transcriptional regulator [Kitasatospora sp. NPDC052868]|uniref:helix-turn-helix domain-containing protein n=1 Tax=Kitasatospora sp. NPDC052868 TaxID=3364060 RepID=UPI0037C96CF4